VADFDYWNSAERKLRRYRTRALTAKLFADCAGSPVSMQIWAYNAAAWDELAKLKEHAITWSSEDFHAGGNST